MRKTKPRKNNCYRLRCTARDLDKKTNAYLVFTYNDVQLAQTEVVNKTQNPNWQPFTLHCRDIAADSWIHVACYRWGKEVPALVGEFEITLGQLTSPGYEAPLINHAKARSFRIRGRYENSGIFKVEEVGPVNVDLILPKAYKFRIHASNLSVPFDYTANCFFTITRQTGHVIYYSEVTKKDVNPTWEPFLLPMDLFGNGDLGSETYGFEWRKQQMQSDFNERAWGWLDEKLTFVVYAYSKAGRHYPIGRTIVTMRKLLTSTRPKCPLINEEQKSKTVPVISGLSMDVTGKAVRRPYSNSGALIVEKVKIIPEDLQPPHKPVAFKFDISASKLVTGGVNASAFLIITRGSHQMYKSEYIKKTRSPHWQSFSLNVAEFNGLFSMVRLSVFDWHKHGRHDYIGSCEVSLLELLSKQRTFFLHNFARQTNLAYRYSGKLHVVDIQEVEFKTSVIYDRYTLQFRAKNLDRKAKLGLGKSNPYFIVRTGNQALYTSEYKVKDSNPSWKSFELLVSDCGGIEYPIRIEAWDHHRSGPHGYIGCVNTTLRDLIDYKKNPEFAFINTEKEARRKAISPVPLYHNSGILVVVKCHGPGQDPDDDFALTHENFTDDIFNATSDLSAATAKLSLEPSTSKGTTSRYEEDEEEEEEEEEEAQVPQKNQASIINNGSSASFSSSSSLPSVVPTTSSPFTAVPATQAQQVDPFETGFNPFQPSAPPAGLLAQSAPSAPLAPTPTPTPSSPPIARTAAAAGLAISAPPIPSQAVPYNPFLIASQPTLFSTPLYPQMPPAHVWYPQVSTPNAPMPYLYPQIYPTVPVASSNPFAEIRPASPSFVAKQQPT